MPKLRFAFVLVLIITFSTDIEAQQIIFNKIPYPDGKTFDFVTGIAQDPDGFMWFATKKGLYHYDGNRVKPYENNPKNPNSLISNLVESVYVDSFIGSEDFRKSQKFKKNYEQSMHENDDDDRQQPVNCHQQ